MAGRGRGRAATMPAWMKKEQEAGRVPGEAAKGGGGEGGPPEREERDLKDERFRDRSPSRSHRGERRRSRSRERRRSRSRERGGGEHRERPYRSRERRHHDDRGRGGGSRSPRRHDRDRGSRWEPQQEHRPPFHPPPAGMGGYRGGGRPFHPPPAGMGGYGGGGRRPPVNEPPPELFTIYKGRVQSIRPFGMFVALDGFRKNGLVHHSAVSQYLELTKDESDEEKIKQMSQVAPEGEEVWVKVTELKEEGPGNWKIGCSMKVVSQANGRDLDPDNDTLQPRAAATVGGGAGGNICYSFQKGQCDRGDACRYSHDPELIAAAGGMRGPPGGDPNLKDEPPEENTIHRATVQSIQPYGVFVQLEGYRRNGLIHLSQLSQYLEFGREDPDDEKVRAMSGVVSAGESIWVKVVEVREDPTKPGQFKVGCSMKLASQANGRDLDPTHTSYRPREGGGGGNVCYAFQKGQCENGDACRFSHDLSKAGPAAAMARAAQGRMDWGHLAADVKQMGDKKYDLIEADDEPEPVYGGGVGGGDFSVGGSGSNAVPVGPSGAVRELMLKNQQRSDYVADDMEPELVEIDSIEQALAILSKHKKSGKKSKKDKKDKKKSKKKHKKEKKSGKKSKKSKKESKGRDSSSSSSDSSDSD